MSQAKVDRYKEEKANRKKILAKEKRKRIAGTICGWLKMCIRDSTTSAKISRHFINADLQLRSFT